MDALDRLISEYLDGSLDAAGIAEIERIVEADPAAARRLADLYADHRVLGVELSEPTASPFSARILSAIEQDRRQFTRGVMADLGGADRPPHPPLRRPRRLLAIGAAAAAVLAAAALVILFRPNPKPSTPATEGLIARVASAVGEVVIQRGVDSRLASSGLEIEAGDEMRVPANASIVFNYIDGTRIEAEPGSHLTLERVLEPSQAAGKRVALHTGALTAVVASQPVDHPMVFITSHAEVVVLGTILHLDANPDSTRVEVSEGRVRLVRASDRQAIDVGKGQYVQAAPDKPLELRSLDLVVKILTTYPQDQVRPILARAERDTLLYANRGYPYSTPPPEALRGHVQIRLPQTDYDRADERYIEFEVNVPVDVYIGYDNRAFEHGAGAPPAWMKDYADAGMTLESRLAGNASYRVFRKSYPAGRIALGGNLAGGDTRAEHQYLVIVAPQGAAPDAPPPKPQ